MSIRVTLQERLAPKIVADRDALRLRVQELEHQGGILHHQPTREGGEVGVTVDTVAPDDTTVIGRVIAAYHKSAMTCIGPVDNMWLTKIAQKNQSLHELLMGGDLSAVAAVLREPAASMLYYGFEGFHAAHGTKNAEPAMRDWQRLRCYDNLLQLAHAVGTVRVENVENGKDSNAPDVETLLSGLDSAFGIKVDFPNPFCGEIGLKTSRGVASYRAIQALYQAWRIRQLVNAGGRVLEIGAGLGRTAYYALRMGVASYTIIDIPMTGVAQGYFLGRTLGEEKVSLFGESLAAPIRILPPVAFEDGEQFDLIVNVDSLTEMSRPTAQGYFEGAPRKAPLMLSINHEGNPFTVADLYRNRHDLRVWRSPCWSRKGYVEELIKFSPI